MALKLDSSMIHTHHIRGVDKAHKDEYKDVIEFKKEMGKEYKRAAKHREHDAKHPNHHPTKEEFAKSTDGKQGGNMNAMVFMAESYKDVQSRVKDPVARNEPTHVFSSTSAVKVYEPDIALRADAAPNVTAREHFAIELAKEGKRPEPADCIRRSAPRGTDGALLVPTPFQPPSTEGDADVNAPLVLASIEAPRVVTHSQADNVLAFANISSPLRMRTTETMIPRVHADFSEKRPNQGLPAPNEPSEEPPGVGTVSAAAPVADGEQAALPHPSVVNQRDIEELNKPNGMLLRKNNRGLSLPKIDEYGCYHNILPGFTKPNFACCFKYEVAMVDMSPPSQPSKEEAKVLLPSTDRINLHAVYRYSPWGCPCEGCQAKNRAGGHQAATAAKIPLPFVSPSNEELAATWCSHAAYIVTVGGYTILTDPVWSDRCSPIQMMGPMRMVPVPIALHDIPYVDVVTISHNHYDHLCTTTIQYLCRHNHDIYNKKRRVGKASGELIKSLLEMREGRRRQAANGSQSSSDDDDDGGDDAVDDATREANEMESPCKSPLYREHDGDVAASVPEKRDDKYRSKTHPVFVVPMGMKKRYFAPLQAQIPELNLDLVVECMWWDTADVSAAVYKNRKMLFERMCGGSSDEIKMAAEGLDASFVPPVPPLLVTVVPAQHWSMRQGLWDRDRELWCSFVYRIGHIDHLKNLNVSGPFCSNSRANSSTINESPSSPSVPTNDGQQNTQLSKQELRRVNAAVYGASSTYGGYKWTLFHSGDTGFYDLIYEEIFKAFGRFDFCMIAIGAYEPRRLLRQQHLDPIESVEIHDRLKSRRSAAMHWGTWILSDEPIDEPPKLLSMAMSEKYRPFLHRLGGTEPRKDLAMSALLDRTMGGEGLGSSVRGGIMCAPSPDDDSDAKLNAFRAMDLGFLDAAKPNDKMMLFTMKGKLRALKKNAAPKTVSEEQLPNRARIFETQGVAVHQKIKTLKPEQRAEAEIGHWHPDAKVLSGAIVNRQRADNTPVGPITSTIFNSKGHGNTETEAVFHHDIRSGMKHLGGRTYPFFDCENPFRVLMHGETWVIPPHENQPLLEEVKPTVGCDTLGCDKIEDSPHVDAAGATSS